MRQSGGRLSLQFEYDARGARTQLNLLEQRQPLKIVRAFHLQGGAALVHMHNLSGGVLAGDRLSVEFDIGPGARAQITSTGATRLYRSRAQAAPAELLMHVRAHEGALLEYLPDPLIPFAGSRYRQRTIVNLEHDAGLFWWDTVAPGREARGELFSYQRLQLSFDLHVAGFPIAIERHDLDPIARPLQSSARLGPYRYFSTFYVCRAGASETELRALEKDLAAAAGQLSSPVIIWGLGRLPAHGLVVRALSRNGRDIAEGLVTFWRIAKQALYGEVAVIPRKIY
ncbi:MAG TPA: urease accessory protein UreD [Bryobacteraceae bacterium]|jgi:urease accessory protein|nr:urease accessory protein UreD [Bryobacteraceae bacterium]